MHIRESVSRKVIIIIIIIIIMLFPFIYRRYRLPIWATPPEDG